jgi:hypothetical protein
MIGHRAGSVVTWNHRPLLPYYPKKKGSRVSAAVLSMSTGIGVIRLNSASSSSVPEPVIAATILFVR